MASYLLGNTLICDTIASANAISKKYGNAFKIVTIEGDVVETGGRMTGGASRRKDSSLLSNERKIQECKEKIVAQERYVEKMKKAIAESEMLRKEAEEEVERLRDKYQNANAEIAALVQRESALSVQLSEAVSDEEVYLAACGEFKDKLKALEFEEANSSQNEEALNAMRLSAEAEMSSQRSQCDTFKEERAEKNKALRALELEETTLRSWDNQVISICNIIGSTIIS
jgi:chromosome segregation protein